MTDIDIVTELRRMYAAAPQGEWTLEPYAGFTSGAMGYDIRIGPNAGDVIVGADRALLDYGEREIGNLIVAMHEALPALLDAVEAVRAMEAHQPDASGSVVWFAKLDRLSADLKAALAALERSDEE